MKLWRWILAAVILYEGLIGISEIASVASPSFNPLAPLATLPSVGSLVQSSTSVSNTVAGGVDLGTALVLYFFVLHDHLWAALT